jgi:hypothetical protein
LLPGIRLTPNRIAFSGTNQEAVQEITLNYHCGRPLKVVAAKASHELLTTRWENNRLQVSCEKGWKSGEHKESVTIVTDDPQFTELRVPIHVQIRELSNVQVHPDRITFHLESGQTPASQVIQLRNREGNIEIESVESTDPRISVVWTKNARPVAIIRVRCESNQQEHIGHATLRVRLRTNSEELSVPISWRRNEDGNRRIAED